MAAFSILLLLWTPAMFGLHLSTGRLVRRAVGSRAVPSAWLTLVSIIRFEGFFYVALAVWGWRRKDEYLLIPLAVLATIHLAAWVIAEARRRWLSAAQFGGAPEAHIEWLLLGIEVFDFGEAGVLVYIGWRILRIFF